MEQLQIPLQGQLAQIGFFQGTTGVSNMVHLFTGSPQVGQGANLANMQENEVSDSISWYSAQSVVYNDEPQNDPNIAFQIDVVAAGNNFNYSSGSGSDPSVTVTGYYIQQSSDILIGYALLPSPKTLAVPFDSLDIQTAVPFPSPDVTLIGSLPGRFF